MFVYTEYVSIQVICGLADCASAVIATNPKAVLCPSYVVAHDYSE